MAQVFEQNMAEASFGYNLSPHALPKVVGVHPRTLATGEHPRRYLSPAAFDWFTEGFDTADLKDARTLLDELS